MANRSVHYSSYAEAVKDFNTYENGTSLPEFHKSHNLPPKVMITSAEDHMNHTLHILKAGNEITGVIFAPPDSFDGQIIEGEATGDFFRRKNESADGIFTQQ
jgi:hypothetical protein